MSLCIFYLSDYLAVKLGGEICSLSELIKFGPILQESGRFVNSGSGSGSGECGRTLLYDNKYISLTFSMFYM